MAETNISPSRRLDQIPGFWPVVVFALTFATHAFYIAEMADHPFFNYPLVDSGVYHREALNILEHGWVGDRVFWQAPLYPYFLAFWYRFIDMRFVLFDIRVIQAAIAAVSAVMLYVLGRRRVGKGVGAGAAILAAFYGPLIYFDAEMLAPVLVVFFYLAMALALDKAVRSSHFSVPPVRSSHFSAPFREGSIAWWPLAGALNAFAALAHGMALLIAPLVCLYALFGRPFREKPFFGNRSNPQSAIRNPQSRFLPVALFGIAVAFVILPVTIRNYRIGGEFVLISHNGPVNMFIGNHPDYDRMVELRPGLEWNSLIREMNQQGYPVGVGSSSRYFKQAMWANIREHPLSIARVWVKKAYLFLHADELKRNHPIYPVRDHSRLMSALLWKWRGPGGVIGLAFPFGLILPLAALGWWGLRQRGIRLAAVELIVAGHFLANLMFFITARYRVPLAPFFCLYAAAGLHWAIAERLWQPQSLDVHRVPLMTALALFFIINMNLKPMDDPRDRGEYRFYMGLVAQENGKPREALAHYQAALRDRPDFIEAHFFLGILYQDKLAQPAKALEQFDWVLEKDPGNMPVLFDKALSLSALGERDRAREILEVLVKNDPENEKYRRMLEPLSQKPTIAPSENRTRTADPPSSISRETDAPGL